MIVATFDTWTFAMKSAQPENAKRSASALRKRKEREKTEARKSQLQGLIKWHMDRMPAEAKAEKTEVMRDSWRKSIEPLVSGAS